jgi:GTP cyclohydrolase III
LKVEDGNGVDLKAGIGEAPKAEAAAFLASEGLHDIRDGKTDEKVVHKNIEDISEDLIESIPSLQKQKGIN